jgi:two-component system chemotaxis response regulator CheY
MESGATRDQRRPLRILIVDDDLMGRRLLQKFLSPYGECDTANDGKEALLAFRLAWEKNQPYDLICLDIVMPEMDGRTVLKEMRSWEQEHGMDVGRGAKIIMTTAVQDSDEVLLAFNLGCEAYVFKPIEREKLLSKMEGLDLIESRVPIGSGGGAG